MPDTDLTIECRRPDLARLVVTGFMQWPALERVRDVMKEQQQNSIGTEIFDNRPMPTIIDRAEAVGAMLDEWVCIAAVSPRIVLTEAEQTEETLCVLDLPYDVRLAIFNATFDAKPTTTAVTDFRNESDSAPAGQSGAALRDEAIDPVGDPG